MLSKLSLRSGSLPFSIGIFLFSIYLLSFSGKFHVMDELAVFTAAHNLAQHGQADINQLIWTNHWTPNPPGIWGENGNLYTKKPPGISFASAPLIGLGIAIPGLNAVQVGLLTNSIVTALTAGLLFIWLIDLGFSKSTATLSTLGYGLCTIAWVYARMFWESSLLAATFLVAVWSIYRATHVPELRRRWPWLLTCGVAVGLGMALRFEAILMIALIGLYLVANQQRGASASGRTSEVVSQEVGHITHSTSSSSHRIPRLALPGSALIRLIAIYLAPSFVIGLGLLYFNLIRYGSIGETGYSQEILFRKPWVGAFGLLFSPGRGLFIYAPLTLLLLFGIRPAWRRLPRLYFGLIGSVCLCYWLFYGAWFAWGGTWGWGPRFLLPILPLLLLFVAEPLEWLGRQKQSGLKSRFLGAGVGILAILSLVVNFLGITVDFNEHFSRLGSNDDFVFNWAAFPPLAHWDILREGLVDLIWLRPHVEGLKIEWPVLLPTLVLFVLAAANLIMTYYGEIGTPNKGLGSTTQIPRQTSHLELRSIALAVAIGTTLLTMVGTAHVPLADQQTKLDLPMLDFLSDMARPGDALLVAMPAFGDVQEISTLLMAYQARPLPTYVWIEDGPRAIQAYERARVQQAIQAKARRAWLFERWHTQSDPTSISATHLDQTAFPVQERWFAQSGKLTLYALADSSQPSPTKVPLNIPFQGGLALVDFAVWNDELTVETGDTLKLRLTWQAAGASEPLPEGMPGTTGGIIAFAQLLQPGTPVDNVAQSDRLLVDLQTLNRSPLQPGQTVQQGYGLLLPDDLTPGSYPLIIGLYHAPTGQRLLRTDDSPDDFVYLTNIVVR